MFIVCGCWLGAPGAGAEAPPLQAPETRLPLMRSAPVIDGRVDAAEWSGAARMERFNQGAYIMPQEAAFWIGSDGKELFVAVVSETPPGGKIRVGAAPAPDGADADTWGDDSIELVLDPLRGEGAGRRLYHANINARGAVWDGSQVVGGSREMWRGNWRTASKVAGERWHFEAAIALADLGVGPDLLPGKPFGLRVGRNWQQTAEGSVQSEWSPLGGGYLTPATMPVVTWDPAAPVTQMLPLRGEGSTPLRLCLNIRNPGEKPLAVQALLKCAPQNSQPTGKTFDVNLAPGATSVVELVPTVTVDEEFHTSVRVTSPDGRTIHYLRDFLATMKRPDPLWVLDRAAQPKVKLEFAYYPSYNTAKVRVDLGAFEAKAQVTGVELSIRDTSDGRVVATSAMPSPRDFVTRMEWKMPPLQDGEYELVATLGGVKAAAIVQPFVRRVFDWECNTLGKSDVVVPPFTPLRARNRRVRAVLREHVLHPLGLWDQVESLGKPLLKWPMRLELTRDGRTADLRDARLRIVTRRGTRVVTESEGKDGGLRLRTRGEWDYDGMLLWTLDIEPVAASVVVEALTLAVPLDDARMPLFHVSTDGLRFNYAGQTPAGQGRVWDGAMAMRNQIVGTYVPYIWAGAEERGFCVFGDNDRGWVTATNAPCQELVRRDGVLELRLNLIARRVALDAPRRLRIAFQATPTKPMPPDWRLWDVHWGFGGRYRNIAILGSAWCWGAPTGFMDYYPREMDFSIYDAFAATRRIGKTDPAFIPKWVEGYRTNAYATTAAYLNHVRHGFNCMMGKPDDVMPYTNPRGAHLALPEGETFLDEWCCHSFPAKRKHPYCTGVGYGVNPSESYRDYAIWHYKKMLETFADGIYWDNTFLKSCFRTIDTDAYELSDGRLQPAAGIFHMRELIRRTAVLQHELGRFRNGRVPVNMTHQTNASMVPISAFAYSLLTWEDRAGDLDFQDRFTRDYIRAESLGRQHGCVPFALVMNHVRTDDPARAKWLGRTAAGVLLVHEIKGWVDSQDHIAARKLLYEYGYGRPEVKVFPYWEAGHPAAVSGADVSTLVLGKPGSALVVACDFGGGGELVLKLDTATLGLVGSLRATDMETGRPLSAHDDGTVRFALKKHDFAMILVAAQGRQDNS